MTLADKSALFGKVIENLEDKIKLFVDAAFEAKEASTNEESKAENKYDTRGLEASYLAAGQARRAQELKEQIYDLSKVELREFSDQDAISISCVVDLRIDEKRTKHVFLLPVGGIEVTVQDKKVQTLTIEAPLGNQLFGMKVGDDFEMNGHLYEVLSIA